LSSFTNRELEFLASLRTNWRRLYGNELAHLLKENDTRCEAQQQVLPFRHAEANRLRNE